MEAKNLGRMLKESQNGEDNKGTKEYRRKTAPRPRSLTTLKLEIISERARKIQRIKDAVESGNYNIDAKQVAQSLMKHFDEGDLE